ncbi:phosphotransferase family protein [Dactylosporangium matsuzakiense]|uniref:Acyl-CoA dehydrogenase n=1 Tax=Dactylosporangium matsuzakiense TaxID=53360 RepID=A0A9W6KCY9_9ACTN|nr:phosphotransferase family protein [Dactylosporangium matsuzakiense]UWZ47122.1 phosphotransferase family protein [Dactylosporangium matsuzakiense]GLK98443.1 acyl-CoA dehydrogenase [Dactylosporangium matsuzakiense]
MRELVSPDRLGPRLAGELGDERWRDFEATLIAGGKSNLTFLLQSRAGSVVLRRPPTGERLPSAHDMGREARVQRALAPTPVPVPGILLEERTGDLLGVPFYVMEKVGGLIVRDELPVGYAPGPADRLAMADALVDVLADIHQVEPEAVGLGDYGRPAGFMARQLRRWRGQWDASKTHDVAELDELGARLTGAVPAARRSTIVHGDYRLDNCMLDEARPAAIRAVLDWELSTLGDPLADLGMLLFYWREPGEPRPLLTPAVTRGPGFPGRAHLAERYARRTGADLAGLAFYEAFAHFKFAVIAQGVAAGAMAGQTFGDLDDEVRRIAAEGLTVIDRRG